MSTEENKNSKHIPINCDILIQVQKKFLPNIATTNLNQFPLEYLVDTLFQEHFQSIFSHYDEKSICTKRTNGNPEAVLIQPTNDDVWIFGYGSLVWKADFPYIDKKQGYVEGYQRRFFQNSIDHRGTPEKPGRVVTLVPSKDKFGRVYGVAYRIAAEHKNDVMAHLDYREKNGYQRSTLKFTEFDTNVSFDITMYIATNDNDSFAGGNEDDLQPIAEQIYKSAGPSGPNREYLYHLADAMRELFPGVNDEHLFKLEEILKRQEQKDAMLIDIIKNKIFSILMNESVDEVISQLQTLVINSKREEYLEQLLDRK